MPKAVLTAILLDHFKNLKFPAKQFQNIASSEITSIGSFGDMPVFLAPAEKRKLWAENGKDKKAVCRQDAQDTGFIGSPVYLSLMMEAPVVENDIESRILWRQTEDIRYSKNYSLGSLFLGKTLGTF